MTITLRSTARPRSSLLALYGNMCGGRQHAFYYRGCTKKRKGQSPHDPHILPSAHPSIKWFQFNALTVVIVGVNHFGAKSPFCCCLACQCMHANLQSQRKQKSGGPDGADSLARRLSVMSRALRHFDPGAVKSVIPERNLRCFQSSRPSIRPSTSTHSRAKARVTSSFVRRLRRLRCHRPLTARRETRRETINRRLGWRQPATRLVVERGL
jgi:hypothetical protein